MCLLPWCLCLNLLNTQVFFELLAAFPTWILQHSVWQIQKWSDKKFITTLTPTASRGREVAGTTAQLETTFLSPLASGMAAGMVYASETWVELWSLPGHSFLEAAGLLPESLSPSHAWRQRSPRPCGDSGITTPKNPEEKEPHQPGTTHTALDINEKWTSISLPSQWKFSGLFVTAASVSLTNTI